MHRPIEIWQLIIYHSFVETLLFSGSPLDYLWKYPNAMLDWIEPASYIDSDPEDKQTRLNTLAVEEFRCRRVQIRSVCRAWRWYADSNQVDTLCVQISARENLMHRSFIEDVISARWFEVLNAEPEYFSGPRRSPESMNQRKEET
jgi:hypothetical protein